MLTKDFLNWLLEQAVKYDQEHPGELDKMVEEMKRNGYKSVPQCEEK